MVLSIADYVYDSSRSKSPLFGVFDSTRHLVVVDTTSRENDGVFRFLEAAQLWLWPEALIFLVGNKKEVRSSLFRPVFRNSIRSLYLGLPEESLQNEGSNMSLTLYSRCLYCRNGKGKIQILAAWYLGSRQPNISDPFLYQMRTLEGHLLKITTMPFFPYINFKLDLENLDKPVVLLDSLDQRIVEALSSALNFTYEIRPVQDLSIGNLLKNGTWTGLFGDMQRGRADFTFTTSTNPERLTVTDLVRTIEADTLVIVSRKPQLLPQYLVIIRPFTLEVWVYLIISIMLWGVALWLLERTRSNMTGDKSMSLDWSIFYSWAVMLDDTPYNAPRYTSGQMLLGWFLVASLVISTVYRSALVAFLSVQSKTKPIDSFQDLVSRSSWRWGVHDFVMSGQVLLFFLNTNDSAVKYVYKYTETPTITEGLKKTLMGGYSLVGVRKFLQSAIALDFTDDFGQTPLYISREKYNIVTDFGWSLRKGAPYHPLFAYTINRLVDAGLINHWMEEVAASRVRETRKKKNEQKNHVDNLQDADVQEQMVNNEVILGTRHLIGVYLVTLVGFSVSLLVLAGEIVFHTFFVEKDRKVIGTRN
ncbi:glutamate receptor ionotropic, kainate glr-3-like [Macrobrachium nipponense]|uniref:glutamate receptor ionotropic, kainate glr-3-like n=1 Tax=Macrobrachium nipponense TaxID=159736 RepID=UPI0030C8C408